MPKELAKIKDVDKKKAQMQRDHLLTLGKSLQVDWIDFYLGIINFRDTITHGHTNWEMCGYENWNDFILALARRTGEGRSTIYDKLRAISRLNKKDIKRLGKTKAFMAARLATKGLLSKKNLEKLLKLSTEDAKVFVKKLCSSVTEAKRRVSTTIPESAAELYELQKKRFAGLTGEVTTEAFWDFFLSRIEGMSDKGIVAAHKGEGG